MPRSARTNLERVERPRVIKLCLEFLAPTLVSFALSLFPLPSFPLPRAVAALFRGARRMIFLTAPAFDLRFAFPHIPFNSSDAAPRIPSGTHESSHASLHLLQPFIFSGSLFFLPSFPSFVPPHLRAQRKRMR
ncbi:hypothetical protein EXIGLDRAFT_730724 [Exidia glandulosa HHB12029]|uniref:Transmembrane protein n=1 Tax=Exidia glandulosa HHB12029 TaxID=1314781 RepID=A0A165C3K3_EXIGL|nr:hypothetical protein EXIGLDRAFT_730724 [Exidia glandulosa HHB12029]